MQKLSRQFRGKSTGKRGFSLVEMVIALGVLAIAMAGGLAMVAIGIGRNTTTRMDTTATNVAQTILEEIASTPARNGAPLTITDCTGNPLTITVAPGGATLVPTGGNPSQPGTDAGDIDFTQPPVPGYQTPYVMCAPGGAALTFDVRWNIQAVAPVAGQPTWAKLVTVAARQPFTTSAGAIYYSPPATLRTVVGM